MTVVVVRIDTIILDSSQIVVRTLQTGAVGFRIGTQRTVTIIVVALGCTTEGYRTEQIRRIVVRHRGDTTLGICNACQIVILVVNILGCVS